MMEAACMYHVFLTWWRHEYWSEHLSFHHDAVSESCSTLSSVGVLIVLSAAPCWHVKAWRTEWGSCWFLPRSCNLNQFRHAVVLFEILYLFWHKMYKHGHSHDCSSDLIWHLSPDKAMDRRNSSFKICSTSLTPSSPWKITQWNIWLYR